MSLLELHNTERVDTGSDVTKKFMFKIIKLTYYMPFVLRISLYPFVTFTKHCSCFMQRPWSEKWKGCRQQLARCVVSIFQV
jgi:hypothetical protein